MAIEGFEEGKRVEVGDGKRWDVGHRVVDGLARTARFRGIAWSGRVTWREACNLLAWHDRMMGNNLLKN